MCLQDNICVELEGVQTICKLIAVHAGLEKENVDAQLKYLKAKDTSIPKVTALSGRKDVWQMPKVRFNRFLNISLN